MKNLWIYCFTIVLIMTCFVSCAIATPNDIAQILIDHEEGMKAEIRKLNEEKPQFEFYYHPVDRVCCRYYLEDDASPEAIVAKYDMNNVFPTAGISALNRIELIIIEFERDDFTEATYQKLQQIKNEESLITEFDVDFETHFARSYMPKIEYYTKSAVKLDFELTDSVVNDSEDQDFIIKTKEEYDDYLNRLLENRNDNYWREKIKVQKALYDESFFEENALIITKTIVRGSGSIDLTANNLYIADNRVYVVVRSDIPVMCAADMQYTSFTLIVPKNDIIHVNEVVTLE